MKYILCLTKLMPLYKTILLHLAWWAFYVSYYFIGLYVRNPDSQWNFIDLGLYFLGNILSFYFFIFITAKFIFNQKRFWVGVFLFIINAFVLYGIQALRIVAAQLMGTIDDMPKYFFQLHTLILAYAKDTLQFTGYGAVYWFYNQFYKQQKRKLALEQEKHKLEIGFLRGRINDHFVYNILNLFHDKAQRYSEELSQGFLDLSDLMRYSVTEYPNNIVLLEKEIIWVKTLISLNKQRFGEKIQVKFEIEGNMDNWQIPHLSILTLVENAFKHGAFKDAPLEFRLKSTAQEVEFTTKNAKKKQKEIISSGIGTMNLKRRLNLIVPELAQLISHEDIYFFYTKLTIRR
ncbi:MAG: sensor histidine kinase [Runella zeae]